jgi:hypothetical protein
MVAKSGNLKEDGQSIVEFLISLPLLVGLAVVLIRVNSAIQMSIVNQQYARAQVLNLAYNSPFYPEKSRRVILERSKMNQLILGVSENIPGSGNFIPKASTQRVTRLPTLRGPEVPQEEPKQRANVRIRDTVTLCTQSFVYKPGGGQPVPIMNGEIYAPFPSSSGEFFYCGSRVAYEQ